MQQAAQQASASPEWFQERIHVRKQWHNAIGVSSHYFGVNGLQCRTKPAAEGSFGHVLWPERAGGVPQRNPLTTVESTFVFVDFHSQPGRIP